MPHRQDRLVRHHALRQPGHVRRKLGRCRIQDYLPHTGISGQRIRPAIDHHDFDARRLCNKRTHHRGAQRPGLTKRDPSSVGSFPRHRSDGETVAWLVLESWFHLCGQVTGQRNDSKRYRGNDYQTHYRYRQRD